MSKQTITWIRFRRNRWFPDAWLFGAEGGAGLLALGIAALDSDAVSNLSAVPNVADIDG